MCRLGGRQVSSTAEHPVLWPKAETGSNMQGHTETLEMAATKVQFGVATNR
jgi:hypothetical protein